MEGLGGTFTLRLDGEREGVIKSKKRGRGERDSRKSGGDKELEMRKTKEIPMRKKRRDQGS